MTMNKLIGALLAAVALSMGSGPALAEKGGQGCDAGIGNGSEAGDPGNSGANNQAANAPAQPGSAAAQADGQHEVDDSDEPN
jgi:hypothetical protein